MDSLDLPAATKADVSLRVPADSAYVSVLRTMTAGLAARLDFTVDDIEDLRIAVGEACALVLPEARPGGDLEADFRLTPGTLTVSVGVPTEGPRTADYDSFAWQVLSTLTRTASADRRRVALRGHLHHRVEPLRPRLPSGGRRLRWPTTRPGTQPPTGRTTRADLARLRSQELFETFLDPRLTEQARHGARDGLVTLHLPLVEHCARRFRNRGEPFEDLVQVGTIGLIKSIDRFDLERGVEFSTYATPTIIGEIKRYFRDKGWAIRVPRRLQELRMQISSTTAELTQTLGRSPTPRELAEAIGCTVEEIVEGIESSNAYSTLSLDAAEDVGDEGGVSMLEMMGLDDAELEHIEIRESIKPLLEALPQREKRILLLRFFRNKTQSEIAEEIGVSQMHVSRLLSRTLDQLRASLQGTV